MDRMRLIDRPEVLYQFDDPLMNGLYIYIMQKIPRLSAIVDQLLKRPVQPVLVNLAVGELIQFTDEEIYNLWSMLVNDSPLAKAALTIRRIRAEQQCMVCFQKYHPLNQETACPNCKSVGAKIITGEEFYLESAKEENE